LKIRIKNYPKEYKDNEIFDWFNEKVTELSKKKDDEKIIIQNMNEEISDHFDLFVKIIFKGILDQFWFKIF